MTEQLSFFSTLPPPPTPLITQSDQDILSELKDFQQFGTTSKCLKFRQIVDFCSPESKDLPVFVNEFWTAQQRASHSLHEVSYRACFKAQLPEFFIQRFTAPGEVVYDPFVGRGTTMLEAALHGRIPLGTDINPLSRFLIVPRLNPPEYNQIGERLRRLNLAPENCKDCEIWEDLLTFYHIDTLRPLYRLRQYLLERESSGQSDAIDAWIRMVATNRLTGHSPGFFSVYTLPPNQATSVKAQMRINERRNQTPETRDIVSIILKKSRSLLKDLTNDQRELLQRVSQKAQIFTASADVTPAIAADSVKLVVTSPPFLDVVQYARDNWLRCWFNGIDAEQVEIWNHRREEAWQEAMTNVFRELRRLLVPHGVVAFEVGEVRNGSLALEELVVPAALAAGLTPLLVLINEQDFTKTSNCWGVDNLKSGTNTNRVVVLRKDI